MILAKSLPKEACRLNNIDGTILSMCWGSQMFGCSSSVTDFQTTPQIFALNKFFQENNLGSKSGFSPFKNLRTHSIRLFWSEIVKVVLILGSSNLKIHEIVLPQHILTSQPPQPSTPDFHRLLPVFIRGGMAHLREFGYEEIVLPVIRGT